MSFQECCRLPVSRMVVERLQSGGDIEPLEQAAAPSRCLRQALCEPKALWSRFRTKTARTPASKGWITLLFALWQQGRRLALWWRLVALVLRSRSWPLRLVLASGFAVGAWMSSRHRR